jgi:hypothetical protein
LKSKSLFHSSTSNRPGPIWEWKPPTIPDRFDGNWHLLELSYSTTASEFTLYVDSVAQSTYARADFSESTADLLIGHRVDNALDDYFPGQIDNVTLRHSHLVVTNALTGNTWYNALNRVVKQAPEGGSASYTKSAYDLADRLIGAYTGYATGTDDPWSVDTNDKIFEQSLLTLDAAGNTLLATVFQRNNGASSGNALTTSNARVGYVANWQDGGGRQVAQANYGTTSPGTTPFPPPPSSDEILLSQTAYNNRGEAYLHRPGT